eukprot:TRINITY_DN3434_c0_g2_i1.p1 TRINITY_DN3434_c0_g2~~TRINITY_DN3434_c0_g2_i1.p1  ORF type:complete len:270 (+),score=11.15 TRINITY_DN3434_c0_g2_i1:45-812(+)
MKEGDSYLHSRGDNITAFLFFVFAMLANCFTLNFTNDRMPNPVHTPPLRDVGFDIIPVIRLQFITDAMLGYFNATLVLLYLHAMIVEGNLVKARGLWNRYFIVWGIAMYMRSVSIALTSLPPTDNHCQNPREISNIITNTFLGFFTFGGMNIHCGDLMFSGHTINIINALCHVLSYGKKFPIVTGTSLLCSLMCVFLIIASRSHYTVDVYIACCITTLAFKSTGESLPPALHPISNLISKIMGEPAPKRRIDWNA